MYAEYSSAAEMLENYARIRREAFAPREEPAANNNSRVVPVRRSSAPSAPTSLPYIKPQAPVRLVKALPDPVPAQRPHDYMDVGHGGSRSAVEMAQRRSQWKRIVIEICAKHSVTLEQLLGDARSVPIVMARHEACYRISQETPLSFVEIGKRLGGRDHTTILHGVRKHKERMKAGII